MQGRSGARSILVACVVIGWVALLGGCVQQAEPLDAGPGWTQLPDSPLPPEREGSVSFWAGDRLVVAGGVDLGEETNASEIRDIAFTGQTVTYVPATNSWVEQPPLVVPNFDGVAFFGGVWMGSYWLGAGSPCRSTRANFSKVSSLCSLERIGLRWELGAGWTVLDAPTRAAYVGTDERGDYASELRPVGPMGEAALFTSATGYSLLSRQGAWSFTPWPDVESLPSAIYLNIGCLVAGEMWTRTTDDPSFYQAGPSEVNEAIVAIDTRSGTTRVIAEGQTDGYASGGYLICLETVALYQPDMQGPILSISGAGPRELPRVETPATASMSAWPLGLVHVQLEAADRAVSFGSGPDSTAWYLDGTTGELTFFPSTLSVENTLWTGELIFAQLSPSYDTPAAGQWFVLEPDGFGPSLSEATFPIPLDTPLS